MNDRKRKILFEAQHLFIEKGFSNTSVQDILDKAKISKGTFYNYFPSKNVCLIAILEYGNEETFLRRKEYLIGKNTADKEVLAKQITIRTQVNREQNFVMLFEEIFHSGDQELKNFIKKNHLKELFWLAERMVDVYGKKASPYALDGAVLLLGMMQHFIHVWTATSKDFGDMIELVRFAIRRLDTIIPDMIETKDRLLGEDVFTTLEKRLDKKIYTKQEIREQLSGFQENLSAKSKQSGKQYIQFLIDELKKDEPRRYLMETVTQAFIESFASTPDESESREIASKIWGMHGDGSRASK